MKNRVWLGAPVMVGHQSASALPGLKRLAAAGPGDDGGGGGRGGRGWSSPSYRFATIELHRRW